MSLTLSAGVTDRDVEVDLRVESGETVALLGPNGAGKSTVLSLIAGTLRPDHGEVVLDGRPLAAMSAGTSTWVPPHARQVALLAQDPLLFPHLTALDNVAFGPRSRGAGRRQSRHAARRWLTEVGVGDLADRRPQALSGGQAQRVAVARALAAEPRLLLLDEPLAALDVAVTPALRQTLRRVLEDRSAVIVTHDVLDALLLADRVVVLESGRVAEEGPTRAVLARPRSDFTARIAGLNMIRGDWREGSLRTPQDLRIEGMPPEPRPQEGHAVFAVFRPEAVAVYRAVPQGSPRNSLAVVITELEPHGDRVRVRAGELAADITPASVAELDLAPGTPAHFVVKAAEVAIYPR
ncbi:MAG: molybdate transport system ATP-binding protein [Nocardioidaceae bacterium]|nr:molybdate transport system ATP-binding protein [Nocardioidaceae bacterium]